MKIIKAHHKKIEEDLLNTNEVIPDFVFNFQMFVEQKKMDFENVPDRPEFSF